MNQRDSLSFNKNIFIYKLVDSKNPDLYYFKALSSFIKGDNKQAVNYLQKSINYGFTDHYKLEKEFSSEIIDLIEF